MPNRDYIANIISYVFAYLNLTFPEIVKICTKLKNYDHLHPQLHDLFKMLNIPVNLGIYIFDGSHPEFISGNIKDLYNLSSCRDMLLSCSMIEDNTLTVQDYITLNNHKEITIKSLMLNKLSLEKAVNDNTNIINSLKNEISMVKLENERLNNDNIRLRNESMAYKFPPPGLNIPLTKDKDIKEYERYLAIKKIWDNSK